MGYLFRQRYTRGGVTHKSEKWYGEYRDKNGKIRRVPLSTDKQAAKAMLADLERVAERRKAGLIDDYADARKAVTGGMVAEYLSHLALKGDGERHIADTTRLLNTVIRECGFATLADLRADTLDGFLARLKKRGRSARTINTYRQAAMGFGNWLVRLKKAMPFNPLAESTKAQGETRVKRRALPLDDLRRLLDVARTRPLRDRQMVRSGVNKGTLTANVRPDVRAKMDRQGRMRVLLYRAAFYTGLRRGELKALRVNHMSLDGNGPFLRLPGAFTKNKQQATLPLLPDFAVELRDWIRDEGISPGGVVFPVGPDVAKHLKRDLRAAGIPVIDDQGRIFDFHALRKCTGTYLNKLGVPITTAKEMLRHSTVELTAGVYNDGDLHDLRGAVEKLPSL